MRSFPLSRFPRSARLLVLAVLLSPLSCWDDHSERVVNPRDPIHGGGPKAAQITDLRASVGDRRVELEWDVDDETNVGKYYIYRRDPGETETALVDSISGLQYPDIGLTNGAPYLYQVSAVLTNLLEGKRSGRVEAVPGVFGVLIEAGAEVTASRQVTVALTAPSGTTAVRIGDSPALDGLPAQTFAASKTWTLPPEDGAHTVYAQFVTAGGNGTSVFSDDILLDTQATIERVLHTGLSVVAPGDLVRFRLEAREVDGEATVDLGTVRTGLVLWDDGTHGDGAADDGAYELDYTVESGIELQDGIVIGRFRDLAGNSALAVNAEQKLTIHRGPDPVALSTPTNPTEITLALSWSQARPTNFAFYRIVRAETPNADTAPTRVNVTDISSLTTTTYIDQSNLDGGRTYYYQVHVYDSTGSIAKSNEVSGSIQNRPPAAVTLSEPNAVSRTELTLSWTRSGDEDFASYALYRSTLPSVDLTDQLLATFDSADVTTHRDSGLTENTRYFYRIYVVDAGGLRTPSNEVGPQTTNAPPAALTLSGSPGATTEQINLAWTGNQDHDFSEYRLYRDLSPAVGAGATLVRTVTDRASLAFVDRSLQDNTDYYYRMFVVDTGDSLTSSNEIVVHTANDPPPPVSLSLVDTTATSVSLSWSQSTAADFAAYKLYMSNNPGVSLTGTPRATVTQKNQLNTVVTGLDRDPPNETTPGAEYFFVIVVEDTAGGTTSSNELRVRGIAP
jgi:fibronectin type 3 domain-containing protein